MLEITALLGVVHDVRRTKVGRALAGALLAGVAVHAVAREELIRALAREAQRRDILDLFGGDVERKASDVSRRLLVGEQELVDGGEEGFGRDGDCLETASQRLGRGARLALLARVLVLVCRAETAIRTALREDVGRIDAAGEEAVDLLLGVEDVAHARVHGIRDRVGPVVELLGLVRLEGKLPEASKLQPLGAEAQESAGCQLVDALEQCLLAGDVRETEEELHELAVQLALESGLVEELLDLVAEQQAAVVGLVVEEELRAEDVACAEQLLGIGVVQREAELPVDVRAGLLAPLLISGDYELLLTIPARAVGDVDAKLVSELAMVADESLVGFQFDHV